MSTPETIGVLAALGALIAIARARRSARRPKGPRHDDSPLHAGRMAVDAEVEDHDIDGMLDAINERRRRREARTLDEELADELMRGTWEEEEK